jgi:hypothetical protein
MRVLRCLLAIIDELSNEAIATGTTTMLNRTASKLQTQKGINSYDSSDCS